MSKLAIIDLDGVVANPEARFARAEAAKQAFLADTAAKMAALTDGKSFTKEADNIKWRTAFDPSLVALDTPIDGASASVNDLWSDGWDLIFLSSRPEAMRTATIKWFRANGFPDWLLNGERLFLKAPAFQFVKTIVWKAGLIQTLAAVYDADDLLIIDDEQDNISEIMKYAERVPYPIKCYHSLKLENEPEPQADDNPF